MGERSMHGGVVLGLALGALGTFGGMGAPLAQSAAAADPGELAAGRKLFARCAACHSLDASGEQGIGPNLHGILGTRAGTQEGYGYSEALRHSGIVWTPQTLDAWIADPKAVVPGTRMAFAGLPSEADRKALIAWIESRSTAD